MNATEENKFTVCTV